MTLAKSKKERSESDPSHDSVEKPIRNDFLSIFEACAQGRTCEKPVKTFGFCRFFVGRHFFERTGQLERKTLEKSQKSTLRGTQNRPKSDQNRSSECFSTYFGRKSRSKKPFRALLGRLGRSKEPLGTTVEATRASLPIAPSRPKSARIGIFDRLARPKWLDKGSEERFWSLLGRFWHPWRVDF